MKSKITAEQRVYIKENLERFRTIREFREHFNKKFNQEIKQSTMESFITKTLKIRRGVNEGKFKKGEGCKRRALPVGTTRKSQGRTVIKVQQSGDRIKSYSRPDWITMQEYVYVQSRGEVPEGKYICFLDGNIENFDIENLYPIDRKVSAYMSRNRLWSANPELTKTAILLAELKIKLNSKVVIAPEVERVMRE